jgi:hypothetical protein
MKCQTIVTLLLLSIVAISAANIKRSKATAFKSLEKAEKAQSKSKMAKSYPVVCVIKEKNVQQVTEITIFPESMKKGYLNTDKNDAAGIRVTVQKKGSILSSLLYQKDGASYIPLRLFGNNFNLNKSTRSNCNIFGYSCEYFDQYTISTTIQSNGKIYYFEINFNESAISNADVTTIGQKYIDNASSNSKNRIIAIKTLNMGQTTVYIDNKIGAATANKGESGIKAKITTIEEHNTMYKAEVISTKSDILTKNKEIAAAGIALAKKQNELTVLKAKLETTNTNIKSNNGLIVNLNKSITNKGAEIAKFNAAVAKAKREFDNGQNKLRYEALGNGAPAHIASASAAFTKQSLKDVEKNLNAIIS